MLPELRFWLPGSWHVVVSTHGVAVLLGAAAGIWWAGRTGGATARLIAIVVAAVGLAGARAAFLVLEGAPLSLGWSGGLASMGGVAAGLVAAWAMARTLRTGVARMLDAVVPAGLLALAVGRLGCFLGGCCFGAPSSLPWAVMLPRAGPDPRHPLPLYSAVADVMLFLASGRRASAPGTRALRALGGFAIARIILETWRDPAATHGVGPVTAAQIACAALLAGTLVAALRQQSRGKSC